jgi:lysophospholipase L1-like esterase
MEKSRTLNTILLLGLICFGNFQSAVCAESGLENGDFVVVCGDSITEQKIYSRYIEDYLLLCQPKSALQVTQLGWSGETADGFVDRQKSILVFKPTVATVCYGMNDGRYLPSDPNRLSAYEKWTTELIKNFKEAGVHLIVVSGPGVVDIDKFKRSTIDSTGYNKTLGDFSDAAKKVAAEQGVVFTDLHSIMMEAMTKAKAKYGSNYIVAGDDGIHPGPNGHLIMAYALLKALGCTGEIGTITVDLKGGSATATDGHKILSVINGNVEVESTRYPFCFLGEPEKSTTRSMIDFIPFNDELNRYKLIVKNATTGNLKVTWGKTSKVFSAADLEKGINLAAEFIENPFCEPFFKVDQSIERKQKAETIEQRLLRSLMDWSRIFPDQSASTEGMVQGLLKKNQSLRDDCRAAVTPVTHTIKIESSP